MGHDGECVDHEARDMAKTAIAENRAHARECDLVRAQLRDFMDRMDSNVRVAVLSAIGTLVAVAGFLFVRVMGWA